MCKKGTSSNKEKDCDTVDSHTNQRTNVVSTDFQGLILAHDESDSFIFSVLQKACLTDTSFLPLPSIIVESIELAFAAMICCV